MFQPPNMLFVPLLGGGEVVIGTMGLGLISNPDLKIAATPPPLPVTRGM